MPPQIRAKYTECERAVPFTVAREVKRQGICDLSVGQIAADAGVHKDSAECGRKHLTNVLRIMSIELSG